MDKTENVGHKMNFYTWTAFNMISSLENRHV